MFEGSLEVLKIHFCLLICAPFDCLFVCVLLGLWLRAVKLASELVIWTALQDLQTLTYPRQHWQPCLRPRQQAQSLLSGNQKSLALLVSLPFCEGTWATWEFLLSGSRNSFAFKDNFPFWADEMLNSPIAEADVGVAVGVGAVGAVGFGVAYSMASLILM